MSESKASVPESIFQPAHPHMVALLQSHQSAPSALQPPLPALHLLLPFSLCLPSPSRCQQVWSDWHGKTAVWLLLVGSLTDPLHSRFSLSFALQSLVIPARLICYPPPPAPAHPPSKPSGGAAVGSGMPRRWHNSHSRAAQRHKFEMFKGDCIVSKRSVQI